MAKALVQEMPHTLAALQCGALSEYRALLIVRESACLSVEHRVQLDAELCAQVSRLSGWGNARVEAEAKKITARLDLAAVVARSAKAAKDRYVSCRPGPDTMTMVTALLPVAQGVAVYADQPVPVTLGLVMADTTLAGDDEEPAWLHGYGPIPAGFARALTGEAATDEDTKATLRRLYRHPRSGQLVAMESRARIFPKGLAELIRLRDQTCRSPYCNAPIRHWTTPRPPATVGPPARSTDWAGVRPVTTPKKLRVGRSAPVKPTGSTTASSPRPPERSTNPAPRRCPDHRFDDG